MVANLDFTIAFIIKMCYYCHQMDPIPASAADYDPVLDFEALPQSPLFEYVMYEHREYRQASYTQPPDGFIAYTPHPEMPSRIASEFFVSEIPAIENLWITTNDTPDSYQAVASFSASGLEYSMKYDGNCTTFSFTNFDGSTCEVVLDGQEFVVLLVTILNSLHVSNHSDFEFSERD